MNQSSSPPKAKKRILFLTPQFPYPPNQGTTIRNYNLIRRVARYHDVDLCTFATTEEMETWRDTPVAQFCRRVYMVPMPGPRSLWARLWSTLFSPWPDMALRLASSAMHDRVRALLAENAYDVVQVEGIEMARYAVGWAGDGKPLRRIFDDHNVEYLLQKRAFWTDLRRPGRWSGALYSLWQWRKLRRYEAAVGRQHDAILAVSAADGDVLAQLLPGRRLQVVPNGVDLTFYADFATAEGERAVRMPAQSVVFTGKMDYRPKVDGVLWFVHRVWPLIRSAHPEAQFFIVGQKPHPRLTTLTNVPGTIITGWVPDVRPYIAGATVYVVPLRVGGGTRLKVLEAMAMRRAIVATPLGAEGYPVRHGQELHLAASAADFAAAVADLLDHPEARRRLGEAGFRFVAERYDWERIVQRLLPLYE